MRVIPHLYSLVPMTSVKTTHYCLTTNETFIHNNFFPVVPFFKGTFIFRSYGAVLSTCVQLLPKDSHVPTGGNKLSVPTVPPGDSQHAHGGCLRKLRDNASAAC